MKLTNRMSRILIITICIVLCLQTVSVFASEINNDEQPFESWLYNQEIEFTNWNRFTIKIPNSELESDEFSIWLDRSIVPVLEMSILNMIIDKMMFDVEKRNVVLAFRYGRLNFQCKAVFHIRVENDTIHFEISQFRVWGIRIPLFIARIWIGEQGRYEMHMRELVQEEIFSYVDMSFTNDEMIIRLIVCEQYIVKLLTDVWPSDMDAQLDEKNVRRYMDARSDTPIEFRLNESELNRLINHGIKEHSKDSSWMPEDVSIVSVETDLDNEIIRLMTMYKERSLELSAHMSVKHTEDTIRLDVSDWLIFNEPIPQTMSSFEDALPHRLVFDKKSGLIPTFVSRIDDVFIEKRQLIVVLHTDFQTDEHLHAEQFKFLPQIPDQGEAHTFIWEIPIDMIQHTIDGFFDEQQIGPALMQDEMHLSPLGWREWTKKPFDVDMKNQRLHTTWMIQDIPIDCTLAFEFLSDEKGISFVFYSLDVKVDGYRMPEEIADSIVMAFPMIRADYEHISAFFSVERAVVTNMVLADTGFHVYFHFE